MYRGVAAASEVINFGFVGSSPFVVPAVLALVEFLVPFLSNSDPPTLCPFRDVSPVGLSFWSPGTRFLAALRLILRRSLLARMFITAGVFLSKES